MTNAASIDSARHDSPKACVLVLLLLSAVSALLFRGVLDIWFISDDLAALYHSTAPISNILFDNRYSNVFYTPLAPLSLKLDFVAFQMSPLPYHIHNIVVLTLISFVFYMLLRLFIGKGEALFGAILLLFSLPSLVTVLWIILRQYLYPTLFSLVVIYCFLKFRPTLTFKPMLCVCLLILTELSFMGKEQFMTLPLVLFIIGHGTLRRRISETWPFFAILALHIMLRAAVLGGKGGYPWLALNLQKYLTTIFSSLFTASGVLFGYPFLIFIALAPLIVCLRRYIFTIFMIWVCTLGIQFFTMSEQPDMLALRYWFIPSLLLCAAVAFGAAAIKKIIIKGLYIALLSGSVIATSLNKSDDIISQCRSESSVFQNVAGVLTDQSNNGIAIVIFDEDLLARSHYFKIIDALYSEKLGLLTYPTFIPADFLIFHPAILTGSGQMFYEMRKEGIEKNASTVNQRLADYMAGFLLTSASLEIVTKQGESPSVRIACGFKPKEIYFYVVTKRIDSFQRMRTFYDRISLPASEEFPLRSLTKLTAAEIVGKNRISYENGDIRRIDDREIEPFPSMALTFFSCRDYDNKITPASDFLLLSASPQTKKRDAH